MPDRRRDDRIDVGLPYLVTEQDGSGQWSCNTIDISPTGMLLHCGDKAPPVGALVNVAIQGPAEEGWKHINTRPMRVIRVEAGEVALTYSDS